MEKNLPVITDMQYQNPVPYVDGKSHTCPDPFILKWCGIYYCYATHEKGVQVSSSSDLVFWEHHGFVYEESGYKNFWAPAVLYHNGLFYLYFSNEHESIDKGHYEFLKLATSENPLGPFVYKKTFFEKFSIDAHPVCWNGEYYLFYSTNDVAAANDEYAGTTISVDRLIDPQTLAGNPVPVVVPSIPQEIYMHNRFKDGRDWYTIEGACFWQHSSTCYLLYSANAYVNEDYFVGFATADPNNDLLEMKWQKYPDYCSWHPLICRNAFVEGTGHNTIAKAPNLVDDWLIYHGRDATKPITLDLEEREMRIDPIFYDGIEMFTCAPSHLPQDVPAKGSVFLEKFCLTDQRKTISIDRPYFIAQMWIKAANSPDGVRYSIILDNSDNCESLICEFHSGLNKVRIISKSSKIHRLIAEAKLPKDFNPYVYHQIDIKKVFDRYSLMMDDVLLLKFEHPSAFGQFSLTAHYSSIEVRGLTVSLHCCLNSDSLEDIKFLYDLETDATVCVDGLVPNGSGCIRLTERIVKCEDRLESYSFIPLGKENSIIFSTSEGSQIFRLDNISRKRSINIFRNSNEGWYMADKQVNLLKGSALSKTIVLDIRNCVLAEYYSTEMYESKNSNI